ncbi:hypothetical protein B0T24DRAFT_72445 [Lasiosphaeria ovina]|uniref:Uncharacterized protein n=1 Tax=Lasiosphaeria ovina TaxID=92902 RepID=A0AAE0NMC0_9PEZI|nr:hypothetical protein B0T24DRAFT_72445 [Lasiosphaeria ovina]
MAELENYLLRMAREVSRRNTRLEEELRDLRSNLEAEKTALETEGKAKLKRQQTIKRMLQDGECQAKDLEIEIQQLQESLRERQDWLKNVQQSNEDLEQEHRQLERSIEIHRTREEQVYRKHNTQENELRRSFEKWAAPYQSAIEPFASTLPEATPAPEPRNPNQAANHPRMSPAAQDDRDETIILPHSNLEDDNEDSQPRRSDRPTRTSRPANEPDRATSNQHRKRGAAETDNSGLTEDSVPQKRQRLGSQQRTIDFEEVYQNGSAEEKHFIIEWPKETGKWYILLCEEHHKHFHKHPLQGAAKHLSGRQHGNLNRGFDNAIEQLGILVQNCTEEKAKLNNQVLRDFLRAYQSQDNSHQITQGEEPPRESHAGSPHLQDDTGRQSSTIAAQAAHPDKHEKAKGKHEKPKATKSRDCPGIINPDAGKVYRAIHEGKVYTCLILPLGSFQSAGVEGNLYNSDLAHEIPVCYDKSGGTIVGWAAEYQDRRKSVRNRRFPILFFVDLEVPDEGHIKIPEDRAALMWMRASKLRSFDLDDPECRNAKGYEGARKFCKRMGLVGSQAPTEGPGRDSNQSGEHSSGRATSNGPQLAEEEQDMIIVLPSPSSPSSTNMASEAEARNWRARNRRARTR